MLETIGFIGLDVMGKPMAHNLIKVGYPLIVQRRGHLDHSALLTHLEDLAAHRI